MHVIQPIPIVSEKDMSAMQKMSSENIVVEHVGLSLLRKGFLFSGFMGAIHGFKRRRLMPGLTFSTELFSRCEHLQHVESLTPRRRGARYHPWPLQRLASRGAWEAHVCSPSGEPGKQFRGARGGIRCFERDSLFSRSSALSTVEETMPDAESHFLKWAHLSLRASSWSMSCCLAISSA